MGYPHTSCVILVIVLKWSIELAERPRPQPRHGVKRSPVRSGFASKGGTAYIPKDFVKLQGNWVAQIKASNPPYFADPVYGYGTFVFKVSKKKLWGLPKPTTPDGDNCEKGFLDAIQKAGVVENDSQIVDNHWCKLYGPTDSISITLTDDYEEYIRWVTKQLIARSQTSWEDLEMVTLGNFLSGVGF